MFSSTEKGINLSKNLKLHLDKRGWTAAELSRRSGVKKQTISDWLAGRSPRNMLDLKRVSNALGMEHGVDSLLFGHQLSNRPSCESPLKARRPLE